MDRYNIDRIEVFDQIEYYKNLELNAEDTLIQLRSFHIIVRRRNEP